MSPRSSKTAAGLSLRGLPALLMLALLQICTAFALLSEWFGGSAGPVGGGAYYLSSHGRLIPVSAAVWHLMTVMQWAALASWISFILLGVGSLFAWKTQNRRYIAARNYSAILVVVATVDILAVFCIPLFIRH